MSETNKNHRHNHRELIRSVEERQRAEERGRREGERSIASNLAMIGALGWLVVVPTLIGIFAGRWLDRTFDSGIFWTATLLFAGVALGCRLAWRRMHQA